MASATAPLATDCLPTSVRAHPSVVFSSCFDSGNGELVSVDAQDGGAVSLDVKMTMDPYCEKDDARHGQWFHFCVRVPEGTKTKVRITNAGDASYTGGWTADEGEVGYRVVYSEDRMSWRRVAKTTYDEGTGCLSFEHTPHTAACYYAYFAPYSYERYMEFLAECASSPLASVVCLGRTLDGAPIDLLRIGTPGKLVVWAIARQHPGESMASWWMEGFLARLLDGSDPVATKALQEAIFYVVPNMNVDGSRRGHLRTNAAGANLNREWQEPKEDYSPEVFYVRNAMDATGMDLMLDVHGDEALPYNFISGSEGVPCWDERLKILQTKFLQEYCDASPDFQTRKGYSIDAPGKANMLVCSNALTERFNCPAMTLEMPFKDNTEMPNEEWGWSPDRCKILGAASLDAMLATFPLLREHPAPK